MPPAERKQNPRWDPRVASAAADAFRDLSQPFLDRIGRDIRTAHEGAVRDLGGMIASATTLAFAVELYLKALHIVLGLNVPKTHNLWILFNDLPADLKNSVERRYKGLGGPPGDDIHALDLQVSVGPFREDQVAEADRKDAASEPPDRSLRSILQRSKDAFETWRYLHERGDPEAIFTISYEFHDLGTAAEAVRGQVVEGLTS